MRARPQDPAPGEWGTPSHTSWEVLAPTGAPDVSGRTCCARRRLQPPAFCFQQGRVCTDARAPSLLCTLGMSLRRGRCSEHRWWPGNAGPCVRSARVRNQKPVSEGRQAGGAMRSVATGVVATDVACHMGRLLLLRGMLRAGDTRQAQTAGPRAGRTRAAGARGGTGRSPSPEGRRTAGLSPRASPRRRCQGCFWPRPELPDPLPAGEKKCVFSENKAYSGRSEDPFLQRRHTLTP